MALSLHAKHSDSFVPKCVSCTAPRPLDQLYDSSVPCDIYNDVLLHCATINISVTEDQVQYVVQQTVKQSKSKLWFSMRAGRVTASTFYAACHTRIEKPVMSLLRSICSDRVGKHARVGRSRPVRGPSHCPAHRLCVSGVRAVPQHCVPDVRRQPGWASPVHVWGRAGGNKVPFQSAWLTTSTVSAGITATSSKCRCSCSWPTSRTANSLCGRRKACSLREFTLIGNGG